MPLLIECPSCRRQFNVGDTQRGHAFTCIGCGESFLVAPPTAPPAVGTAFSPTGRPALRATAGKPLPRRQAPPESLGQTATASRVAAPPRDFAPPEPDETEDAAPASGTNWSELLAGAVVLALFLRIGLGYAIPLLGTAPPQPTLVDSPYALDDPSQRTHEADGRPGSVKFPDHIGWLGFSPGIVSGKVQLGAPGAQDQPGDGSELTLYEPAGKNPARSLACVLVSPAGGTLVCGPRPSANDVAWWLDYAKAGLAVVEFHVDGEIDLQRSTPMDIAAASARFFAAQAGLANARNALEFVLARMPEVDPQRIYVAGQGSAATLALLFAEHERRIAGCIAYAPVVDVASRFRRLAPELVGSAPEGLLAALEMTSPARHIAKLGCPVYLVETEAESKADLDEFRSFIGHLHEGGKRATVVSAPSGTRVMFASATPQAIRWLAAPEKPESDDRPPAPNEPVARNVPSPAPSHSVASPDADPEQSNVERQVSDWVASATTLAADLGKITPDSPPEAETLERLEAAADSLASRTQQLRSSWRADAAESEPMTSLLLLKAAGLDRVLAAHRERLEESGPKAINQSKLLPKLDECRLPAELLDSRRKALASSGRPPVANESRSAEDRSRTPSNTPANVPPSEPAAGPPSTLDVALRRFHSEIAEAFKNNRTGTAVHFLRAGVLLDDDAKLIEAVRWSPTLKRPMAIIEWGFGAEVRVAGPAPPPNLNPSTDVETRTDEAERQLSDVLRAATGTTGVWLAQGLKNRVETGAFGDWDADTAYEKTEHRGVALMDFAKIDAMLTAAKSARVDALMVFILTSSGSNQSNNTLAVELYDVASGEKLWESKPLSTGRLITARRQGKALDSELATAALKFIDDEIVLRSMPQLQPQFIRGRIAALRTRAPSDPMSAIIELRYYRAKKLISEADALAASAKWLNENTARQLWSASARPAPRGRRRVADSRQGGAELEFERSAVLRDQPGLLLEPNERVADHFELPMELGIGRPVHQRAAALDLQLGQIDADAETIDIERSEGPRHGPLGVEHLLELGFGGALLDFSPFDPHLKGIGGRVALGRLEPRFGERHVVGELRHHRIGDRQGDFFVQLLRFLQRQFGQFQPGFGTSAPR